MNKIYHKKINNINKYIIMENSEEKQNNQDVQVVSNLQEINTGENAATEEIMNSEKMYDNEPELERSDQPQIPQVNEEVKKETTEEQIIVKKEEKIIDIKKEKHENVDASLNEEKIPSEKPKVTTTAKNIMYGPKLFVSTSPNTSLIFNQNQNFQGINLGQNRYSTNVSGAYPQIINPFVSNNSFIQINQANENSSFISSPVRLLSINQPILSANPVPINYQNSYNVLPFTIVETTTKKKDEVNYIFNNTMQTTYKYRAREQIVGRLTRTEAKSGYDDIPQDSDISKQKGSSKNIQKPVENSSLENSKNVELYESSNYVKGKTKKGRRMMMKRKVQEENEKNNEIQQNMRRVEQPKIQEIENSEQNVIEKNQPEKQIIKEEVKEEKIIQKKNEEINEIENQQIAVDNQLENIENIEKQEEIIESPEKNSEEN